MGLDKRQERADVKRDLVVLALERGAKLMAEVRSLRLQVSPPRVQTPAVRSGIQLSMPLRLMPLRMTSCSTSSLFNFMALLITAISIIYLET